MAGSVAFLMKKRRKEEEECLRSENCFVVCGMQGFGARLDWGWWEYVLGIWGLGKDASNETSLVFKSSNDIFVIMEEVHL